MFWGIKRSLINLALNVEKEEGLPLYRVLHYQVTDALSLCAVFFIFFFKW